jgi:hypothetical protein
LSCPLKGLEFTAGKLNVGVGIEVEVLRKGVIKGLIG